MTVARWSTICLSKYYGKKPDGLTVFSEILVFTENQRYWQLLLILLSKNHGLSPNDRFGIKNKRFYFGIVFVFTIFANIKVKTRQIIIK